MAKSKNTDPKSLRPGRFDTIKEMKSMVSEEGVILPVGGEIPEALISFLRQDELDYEAASKEFGSDILPALESIIEGQDENMATKATYLAGYIGGDDSAGVLKRAAEVGNSPVRVAAAFGAKKIKGKGAEEILKVSLSDHDPGVLKYGLKSVNSLRLQKNFKGALDNISKASLEKEIKDLAKQALKKAK